MEDVFNIGGTAKVYLNAEKLSFTPLTCLINGTSCSVDLSQVGEITSSDNINYLDGAGDNVIWPPRYVSTIHGTTTGILKLTGTQGDVMKESMNVALTLAYNLSPADIKADITTNQSGSGIHIHCPDGSTPKDGPSAGTAITTTLYSLFNNKKIKNTIAITGEITLDGNVTAIGGLDLKILGGIKAGVKEFIFPKENEKDFDGFMEKYKDDELTKGIKFHSVEHIDEVFDKVFE